jgi:hypothetical protein
MNELRKHAKRREVKSVRTGIEKKGVKRETGDKDRNK